MTDAAGFPPADDPRWQTTVIASSLELARAQREAIAGRLAELRLSEEHRFEIELSLEEALANAVRHGNAGDPKRTVTIRCLLEPALVAFIIEDQGTGFDPAGVPDPTTDDRLDQPGGRGIWLIRNYMDMVEYRNGGRSLYMLKRV